MIKPAESLAEEGRTESPTHEVVGAITGALIGIKNGVAGIIAGALLGAATSATVENMFERSRRRRHVKSGDAGLEAHGGDLDTSRPDSRAELAERPRRPEER